MTHRGDAIMTYTGLNFGDGHCRRRIYTEEKAKVVAAVWRKEWIQFLATLDIFHQDDFEHKDE